MNIQKANKDKMQALKPVVWVGKNGLSEDVLDEIKNQLKKKELIKVKLVKSFITKKDKKIVAKDIADKTSSKIIGMVGFIVTLYKPKA